ncbi:hypothetical protein AUEXF2481DRAFT_149781 [Aureobasidium subglaciale EXF-2481]|uniref:Uncharacterized protein n=1 Tax=Aureobasidium subglaciale (strain EXF-2481) TaxID=1043005 RepID=A0A074Z2Z7_AURSE|nr:uncharacterized protein AUEXF2481DRAFT_149781 [Aureobasidium subglaciale EXF-2481]KER00638.1 hypothetical protein AUEXF2481DRAFT_149781 [Aureobasidium subglaciale EXF-2481]
MANRDMVNLKAAMEVAVWEWAAVVRSLAHIILVATSVDPSSRVGNLGLKAAWAGPRAVWEWVVVKATMAVTKVEAWEVVWVDPRVVWAALQEVWKWAVVEAMAVPVVPVVVEVLVAGRMATDLGPLLDTRMLLTISTNSAYAYNEPMQILFLLVCRVKQIRV